MGAIVFNNISFDSWLTKKADEILFKGQDRGISNEEMLILILKAHTQHFHHMDVEFRQEFKKIDERFEKMDEEIDSKFDKMWSFQKWQVGILITLLGGLYLKLFLG
jgi:hypothetical protein